MREEATKGENQIIVKHFLDSLQTFSIFVFESFPLPPNITGCKDLFPSLSLYSFTLSTHA